MDCSAINRNYVTQHGIVKVRFPKRCIHYAFTCMVKLSFPSIEHWRKFIYFTFIQALDERFR